MTRSEHPPSAAARMHHYEWVTADQEATRRFYEDVIGLPLVCVWTEEVPRDGRTLSYVHSQYAMGDGSVLSFFSFADAADQLALSATQPGSPFVKMALLVDGASQDAIETRLLAEPATASETFRRDHGYCRSLYTRDPNGLVVEFTVDTSEGRAVAADKSRHAHADLRRWIAGDHTPNNDLRQPQGTAHQRLRDGADVD